MSVPSKYVVRKGPVYYAVQREVERRNVERRASLASADNERRRLDEEAARRSAEKERARRLNAIEIAWKRAQSIISHGNPTIAQVQKAVCEFYEISFNDLISHRKLASITRPRQIAMSLAKELTVHSLPEIGRRFDRDHSTVIHATRVIAKLCEHDSAVATDMAAIRGMVRDGQPARAAAAKFEAGA